NQRRKGFLTRLVHLCGGRKVGPLQLCRQAVQVRGDGSVGEMAANAHPFSPLQSPRIDQVVQPVSQTQDGRVERGVKEAVLQSRAVQVPEGRRLRQQVGATGVCLQPLLHQRALFVSVSQHQGGVVPQRVFALLFCCCQQAERPIKAPPPAVMQGNTAPQLHHHRGIIVGNSHPI